MRSTKLVRVNDGSKCASTSSFMVPNAVHKSGHCSDVLLVHVAPPPVLPRLEGLHDLVPRRLRVSARVAHRGRITTADVPARQTQSQMHPAGTGRNAVLAPLGRLWGDEADVLQVRVAEDGSHGLHRNPVTPGSPGRAGLNVCPAVASWRRDLKAGELKSLREGWRTR